MPPPAPARTPARLIRVNDRVHSAVGYAISNVLYVDTGESVVVIDTTESMASAAASYQEFGKVCALPVRHIVYTHFHGDHTRGAKVFHTPQTQVIAHRRMPEQRAAVQRINGHRRRVTRSQFGLALAPEQRGVTLAEERASGYVPPDVLVDDELIITAGDLTFELRHTEGETVDHLMIWVPELATLFPGDLFYGSFPMLSNPLKPDRPILAWARSLDRMRELRPEHLVPSHGAPITGAEQIDTVLGNYARAIRHVHDRTVELLDRGLPLEEIRERVTLPADLAELPYLRQRYGTVPWSVTGVFRQYTGWCHFDPAELYPGPRAERCRALVEVAGGPGPLLERAARALDEQRDQLALELLDVVLAARPGHRRGLALRVAALRRLAEAAENGVARNIYATAAQAAATRLAADGRPEYSGIWLRPEHVAGEHRHGPDPDAGWLRRRAAATVAGWHGDADGDGRTCGFWAPGTRTREQADARLVDTLLTFLPDPDRPGSVLEVGHHLPDHPGFEVRRIAAPPDGPDLPDLADQRFDAVVCVESVFRFPSRAAFLGDAYRLLRPGGRLVLSDVLPATPRPVDPRDYRDLYLRAGFDRVEIVDATERTSAATHRHTLRRLRRARRRGGITPAAFRRRRARALAAARDAGYYLLVCATREAGDG
ncbi:alkyl sulfatase dimerization domain-containing protein [Actinoplanes sp. L3-i22]|uniref:alkyl sulfatase dimerization domain-containing protein n=1 Tax=Actinoplanes sp. L3-i22 TaxID=2836373 RepID=UPI001C751566|nr:alkyl sulfatase dimerization domain-containing protein [Actinoplanes sp. L3-i22]BCY09668.1 hypothetical protein L3i22_047560 [Actinoplanes sp. L3-i22]